MYALLVRLKEAKGNDGTVITKAGSWGLVQDDAPDHWVEATVYAKDDDPKRVPVSNPKIFGSQKAAEDFAQRWKGHPWYVVPDGVFEVVKVKPKYEQRLVGYERA